METTVRRAQEAQPMHRTSPIVPSPASEPGALDGFESTCSCGFRMTSTIESMVRKDATDHVAYMTKKEGQ